MPAATKLELRKVQREHPLCTVRDMIKYLKSDIAQAVDEKVAEALRQRRFQDLPGFRKHVHSLQEPGAAPPSSTNPEPSQASSSSNDETKALLQRVCAALEQKPRGRRERRDDRRPGSRTSSAGSKPRTPRKGSPSRTSVPAGWPGGCFHCGKKGHPRSQCRSFKKYMAEKGTKKGMPLPSDYEGELEKFKRKNGLLPPPRSTPLLVNAARARVVMEQCMQSGRRPRRRRYS